MKKKKSIIPIILILCAAAAAGLGLFLRLPQTAVIGGADGPTVIFVAGKTGGKPDLFFTVAAILAGAALGYYLVSKRRKR